MEIKDYKDLFIWKQAIIIATRAYKITSKLPSQEKFGISSQIQRAAVSVPSNIAEGYNRKNKKEYVQFLYIATGSLAELETQIIICSEVYKDLQDELSAYLSEINKLRGLFIILIKKLSQ